MPQQVRPKIRSIALIAAIVLVSMALGIALNGRVIPSPVKPLSMEGLTHESVAAVPEKTTILQNVSHASPDIKQLETESKQLRMQGDQRLSQANTLLSQVALASEPGHQASATQRLEKRLEDIKSRLDRSGRKQP